MYKDDCHVTCVTVSVTGCDSLYSDLPCGLWPVAWSPCSAYCDAEADVTSAALRTSDFARNGRHRQARHCTREHSSVDRSVPRPGSPPVAPRSEHPVAVPRRHRAQSQSQRPERPGRGRGLRTPDGALNIPRPRRPGRVAGASDPHCTRVEIACLGHSRAIRYLCAQRPRTRGLSINVHSAAQVPERSPPAFPRSCALGGVL